jgi:two-component system, LytTR family, sensor kinase
MQKNAIYKVIIHTLLWLSLFLLFEFSFTINLSGIVTTKRGSTEMIFQLNPYRLQLIGITIKIFFFYTNVLLLMPKLLNKRKIVSYILAYILLLITCYYLDFIIIKFIYLPNLPYKVTYFEPAYTYYIERVIPLFYFIISILAIVYFSTTNWLLNEHARNQLKEQQLESEIKILKYQLNPHFLFNTLNNLFSIAQDHKIPELEIGISKLSSMMRYMLYESNAKKINLNKEIDYLKNYIAVFELRMHPSDDYNINFDISGNTQTKKIAPLLLLPLVENAIKHGIDFKKNSWITIYLEVLDTELIFSIKNSIHLTNSHYLTENSGIGIENLTKRLLLIYPNNRGFTKTSTEDTFHAILKINI